MSVLATSRQQPSRRPYRLDVLVSPKAGQAVIRGGALRAGGYLLSILLTAVSMPLMTRHLGVADFGRFVTVLSLIAIVAGVAEAGLMNIGVREYATRDAGSRWGLMRNLIGMRTALTVGGVGAALLFAIAAGYPGVVVAGTALAGTGLLASQLQETLTVPLSASLRLGPVAALALVRQSVLVSMIVLLVLGGASLLPFYAAAAVASSAALLATIAVTRRRVPLLPAFHAPTWRPLLRDVLPYAAATAMGAVFLQVTMIATSLLASDRQTGYFASSFRVFEVLIAIGGILALSAFPLLARAARDDRPRFAYLSQRMFEVAVIVGIGTALLTFAGAHLAIRVLGGSAFGPAVPVLRLEALAIPFAFLVAVWGYALLALRRHRALVLANAGALLLALLLAVTLIPVAGAGGAALCVVLTEIALAGIYRIAIASAAPQLGMSFRPIPRVLVATALAAFASAVVPLPNAVGVAAAGLVYVLALVRLRVVPPEVWSALPVRHGGRTRAGRLPAPA